MRLPWTLCLALLALALRASPAAADDTSPERLRARAAFAEGLKLLEQERGAEAESQFRSALEYKETAGLHYYIALSLEKQQRWIEARHEYELAEESARAQQAEDVARLLPDALARLELALPRVAVVGMPPGSRLVVDGLRAESDTLRLDPGPHSFLVEAPGYVSKSESVVLVAGENRVVAGGLEKERVVTKPPPSVVSSSVEQTTTSSSWRPTVFWSGVAFGALGAGVGITAVIVRENAVEDVKERASAIDARGGGSSGCREAAGQLGEDCSELEAAVGRRDDASNWMVAGFAAAGAGVAAAFLTHLFWPEETVRVAPFVAWDLDGRPERGTLSVQGVF